MADLSVKIAGLQFKNPIEASAGHITQDARAISRCIKAGAGVIATKCITSNTTLYVRPRPSLWFGEKYGVPNSLCHIESAFWSLEEGAKIIRQVKPLAEEHGCKIIGSAYGEDRWDEWKRIASLVVDAGADIVKICPGCPIWIREPTEAAKIIYENARKAARLVKEEVDVPVICAIGPTTEQSAVSLAKRLAEDGTIDAFKIQIIPSGVIIDIENARPVVPYNMYLGRHQRGLATLITSQVTKKVNIPVVSCDGIWTWRDAVERLMAGATLCGMQTAIIRHGYKRLTEVIQGIDSFLDRKDYSGVKEIIGVARPYIMNENEFEKLMKKTNVPKESVRVVVDLAKCDSCGECTVCNYGAMTMVRGQVVVHDKLCERCGACVSICHTDAISIQAV